MRLQWQQVAEIVNWVERHTESARAMYILEPMREEDVHLVALFLGKRLGLNGPSKAALLAHVFIFCLLYPLLHVSG